MAIDRTSIISGPARIELGSTPKVFYSKGDVTVTVSSETLPTVTSKWGKVDEILKEPVHKVAFEPVGEWENLAELFPHKSLTHGASIFGGTDTALKIIGSDGEQWHYKNAAVSKEPPIFLGITDTLLRTMEFTCLRSNDTAWTTAGGIVEITSVTPPSDTEFALSAVKRQSYAVDWQVGAEYEASDTVDGTTVTTQSTISPVETDNCGIVDYILTDYQVEATCKLLNPGNFDLSDLLAAMGHQGAGAARGTSLNALSGTLEISGTGVFVYVYGAALRSMNGLFSAENLRNGDMRWIATKAAASDPLIYVGTSAPA